MVARLYSWDDAGAPVLSTSNDASLLTILTNCLVSGYGTRTPAGWTQPYLDVPNQKGVFKPGLGHEIYLRVDDNYSYQYAKGNAFGTMTDIDTGSDEWPRPIDLYNLTFIPYIPKRYRNTSGHEKWFVLATEEWFYYWQPDPNGDYPSGFFFGKVDIKDSVFPNPYLFTSYALANPPSGSNSFYMPLYNTSADWWLKESYYKTGLPAEMKLETINTNLTNPNPLDGTLDLTIEQLNDVNGKVWYGSMPGRFKALGSTIYVYLQNTKLTIAGKNYITAQFGGYLYVYEYDVDVG